MTPEDRFRLTGSLRYHALMVVKWALTLFHVKRVLEPNPRRYTTTSVYSTGDRFPRRPLVRAGPRGKRSGNDFPVGHKPSAKKGAD